MRARIIVIENILLPIRINIDYLINYFRDNIVDTNNFINLAPTDEADKSGIYSGALRFATDDPNIFNIALTGPYGSGKSSIIRTFLKSYQRPVLHISLAAFVPDNSKNNHHATATRQEIERSILQQMLYGADANILPFSRFRKIKSPRSWSIFISLYITLGIFSCWQLLQKRDAITSGQFFATFATGSWFNLACFIVGGTFLWMTVHRCYVWSFGVALKSISLKDIQITPEAIEQESILNRHLDEIIYFFQSTKYELVVIEDLDRFDSPEIFVTLREINSLVNANSNVKRKVRFLYALRDDMFVNTDRTKFFEFIIPVIPIINSSNSIDKMLEQGKRLSLDKRLDSRFIREVSRYLNDLRLIQNIFNEYSIYSANLDNNGASDTDANKLLAVLIYKNVFPSDFENLHRGNGNLAQILGRRQEYIAKAESRYKAEIARVEEQIAIAERQLPLDLQELRQIYVMALFQKLPADAIQVDIPQVGLVPINSLGNDARFDQLIGLPSVVWRSANGHQDAADIRDFEKEVSSKTFEDRKVELEHRSTGYKDTASKLVRELRAKLAAVSVSRFNEIIRQNAVAEDDLFSAFSDNAELARFLVFEGYLDDTYYQYISLFHSGRLSPSDNRFLLQIREFKNPEPDFQIDNQKEVIAEMRDEDFGQNYVLNVKIIDYLFDYPTIYREHIAKLCEFVASNFETCRYFFSTYYASGENVSAFIVELVRAWKGFVPAAINGSEGPSHAAQIVAHLPLKELAALPEEYPEFSAFVSAKLPEILAFGLEFDSDRLKHLQIETTELAAIEPYPEIARMLFEEGFYQLSIDNFIFIFRHFLEFENMNSLDQQHYTSVLSVDNADLTAKIDHDFRCYLENVLLKLDGNSEESIPAIVSIINHDEINIETLKMILEKQSAILPTLDAMPTRLHSMVFQLRKIDATWANCLAFLSSETYDADILTAYVDNDDICTRLLKAPIPHVAEAYKLRSFLVGNNGLQDRIYRNYVKELPNPFAKFPAGLASEKLRVLIEEEKVTFSVENFDALGDDQLDLQVLFVERNVGKYLEGESEFESDDDFRDLLLSSKILDEDKLKIIALMDVDMLIHMPGRAAKIGTILSRTDFDIGGFGTEAARAMIVNSKPDDVQIALFNKFQSMFDLQQIREILQMMPEPFSDIKVGYRVPRIKSTSTNTEFVAHLKSRGIISSWSKGGWLDNDIRIFLKRV